MQQQDVFGSMGPVEGKATGVPIERFYTTAEVSKLLRLSEQSVRIHFRGLKGVLVMGDGARKRLRIPEQLLRDWIDSRLAGGGA